MKESDLNDENITKLTLETPDETVTVGVLGSLGVIEFMELVELLVVNAKYDKADLEKYIVEWAKDIKATKQN